MSSTPSPVGRRTASRIPPGRFIWNFGVIEIWLIVFFWLVFPHQVVSFSGRRVVHLVYYRVQGSCRRTSSPFRRDFERDVKEVLASSKIKGRIVAALVRQFCFEVGCCGVPCFACRPLFGQRRLVLRRTSSFSHFRTKSSAMFRYDVWSIWCSFLSFGFQNCQSYGPWMPQCSFRELRGSLGFHFCSSGRLLGCILGALGMPWSPFFHFWVSPGQHFWEPWGPFGLYFGQIGGLWGALGIPMPPQPPKTEFS